MFPKITANKFIPQKLYDTFFAQNCGKNTYVYCKKIFMQKACQKRQAFYITICNNMI